MKRLNFKQFTPVLIVADDMTGTLDTAIKFSCRKAKTIAISLRDAAGLRDIFSKGYDVVAVNSSTRHLSPQESYEVVYSLVSEAVKCGVGTIYKKTDSVLRGNIASELSAVKDACKASFIPFVPAYAEMERTVQHGVMYVCGRPLSETLFASDPFEKTTSSHLVDIFSSSVLSCCDCQKPGSVPKEDCADVVIYDGRTRDDSLATALALIDSSVRVFSGCAGFADSLAQCIFGCERPLGEGLVQPCLIACGSVNPVSKAQLDWAQNQGVERIRLSERELTATAFTSSLVFEKTVERVVAAVKESRNVAIDTMADVAFVAGRNIGSASAVSTALALIVKEALKHARFSLFIVGGDTLLSILEALSVNEIKPLGQLEEGIALSLVEYKGVCIQLMSKSGGFGPANLIGRLLDDNKIIRQEVIS